MFASALKAAGSAAAGLMSGAAALPFTTESEYTSFAGKSPWRMYKGKKDVPDPKGGSNKVECTIFVHDLKGASPAQSSAARNAMKKLRTIKHPYLVKCLDAGEINDQKGGGTIYIVTEPVQPLSEVLSELQQTPASIVWGVYTLAAAVNFLNIDCKIVHGQVSIEAIFVDRGMDWKLGGFELCSAADAADASYFGTCKELFPKRLQSPELARGNMEALGRIPVVADWWALGCTTFEVFCGTIRSPSDLKNVGEMPELLRPDYMRLLSGNPAARLRPAELLQNALFDEDYVSLQLFLETLNIKDAVEKDRFFTKLADRVPALPKATAQWKVLPALCNSLEYGGGSARALEPLLKIAGVLTEEEMQEQVCRAQFGRNSGAIRVQFGCNSGASLAQFGAILPTPHLLAAQVVPTVVKLFANTDRQMRIPLLERLPTLVPHLTAKTINDAIFQARAPSPPAGHPSTRRPPPIRPRPTSSTSSTAAVSAAPQPLLSR